MPITDDVLILLLDNEGDAIYDEPSQAIDIPRAPAIWHVVRRARKNFHQIQVVKNQDNETTSLDVRDGGCRDFLKHRHHQCKVRLLCYASCFVEKQSTA